VRHLSGLGVRTWFFLTVDYIYGRNVQRDATAMIEASGGRVLGAALHGFETTDFSNSLLTAQSSKADVVVLATTTAHSANVLKQADEFGMRAGGQRVAPLSLTLLDVRRSGLPPARASSKRRRTTGIRMTPPARSPSATASAPAGCRTWCRPAPGVRRRTT